MEFFSEGTFLFSYSVRTINDGTEGSPHDGFLVASWWLPGGFLVASWWLPGGFLGLPRKESEQRGLSDMYVCSRRVLHYSTLSSNRFQWYTSYGGFLLWHQWLSSLLLLPLFSYETYAYYEIGAIKCSFRHKIHPIIVLWKSDKKLMQNNK